MKVRYYKTLMGKFIKREGKHSYFIYDYNISLWVRLPFHLDGYDLNEISEEDAMLELI
jgi:hypothetical protein